MVLVLALGVGGVVWYQSQNKSRDSVMVPYTMLLPQKIIDGTYYKKGDDNTVCSDCLTSTEEIKKLGIKSGFPWAAHYVQNPAESAAGDSKHGPTVSVIGIQGQVAQPVAAVDGVLARMHEDETKKAKALGVTIQGIEPVKVAEYKGDTFDGTVMKCESLMLKPKAGLDNDVVVARCVWGDTSAVGIVQQQVVGVESSLPNTNDLAHATLKVRNEARQPHPRNT
ncbi:hypothetical protein ACH4VR_10385 [Streptomyces sp. NPDC020883]|uniref:hypothetical protein n=1 Tax=Streptomyces sp. NPDC020883 TaxID=3365099 RepID=UPI0037BD2122